MAKDYQMNRAEWQRFKHDNKLFKTIAQNRFYCMCGHSVLITPSQEKALCSYCNRWIYRNQDKQKLYEEKVKLEEERLKQYRFRKELLKRL